MGACFSSSGRIGQEAANDFRKLLSDSFPDTTLVLPWRTDLELLTLITLDSRKQVGYSLLGSLAEFVNSPVVAAKLNKKKEELDRLPLIAVGQKIERNVDFMKEDLSKFFIKDGLSQSEGQLSTIFSSEASFKLTIEEHYQKTIERVATLLKNVELDLSPGSLALTARTVQEQIEKKNQVTCYVVDRIYLATDVSLDLSKSSQVVLESIAKSGAVPLSGGLELRHVRGKSGILQVIATQTNSQNKALPFSLAFGCQELIFGSNGKIRTHGPASTIGPASESAQYRPSPKLQIAKLVEEKGGYVFLGSRVTQVRDNAFVDSGSLGVAATTTSVPQAEETPLESIENVLGKRGRLETEEDAASQKLPRRDS